ncbi:MAG: hypothetical protein JSS09_07770 [Verrucomicrobia bacterium]|nr:hypothetical protein [Verrucomicrobiota bacterium]
MTSPVSTAETVSPFQMQIVAPIAVRPYQKINTDVLKRFTPPPPSNEEHVSNFSSKITTAKDEKHVSFGRKYTYPTATSGKHGIPNSVLWWSPVEEDGFRDSRNEEIMTLMATNPNITELQAQRILYEPGHRYPRVNPNVSYLEMLKKGLS